MKLLWKAVVLQVGVQAHPQKFWFAENLRKIPENPGKKWRSRFAEKHMKTFFGGYNKKRSWYFWEKICRQKLHKNLSGNLGKFGQKPFAPQKFACSYTYDENAPPPSLTPF